MKEFELEPNVFIIVMTRAGVWEQKGASAMVAVLTNQIVGSLFDKALKRKELRELEMKLELKRNKL